MNEEAKEYLVYKGFKIKKITTYYAREIRELEGGHSTHSTGLYERAEFYKFKLGRKEFDHLDEVKRYINKVKLK